MDQREALVQLQHWFPGKSTGDAMLLLTKQFLQPLNDYIRYMRKDRNFHVASIKIGSHNYGSLDLDSYRTNDAAEVLIRCCAIAGRYPNRTEEYISPKKQTDDAVKAAGDAINNAVQGVTDWFQGGEKGEPITIAIVLTIIVALAPVILPFITDLVNSWFNADAKTKKDAADAANTKTAIDNDLKLQQEADKRKIYYVIGGAVIGVTLIVLVVRRVAN